MREGSRSLRSAVMLAAVLVAGIVGGTAVAHLSGDQTGAPVTVYVKGDHDIFNLTTYAPGLWTDVPGAVATVTSTSEARPPLVRARWMAESRCFGSAQARDLKYFCSARIVATNANGGFVDFLPETDDYAFDSAQPKHDMESHSVERFVRLPMGTWDVKVQVRNAQAGVTSTWDDWVFTVEVGIQG